MANETLKPGDVVTLKSGSPEMTVDYVYNDGRVFCTWYDFRTNTMNREVAFQGTSLKLYDSKSSSFVV